MLTDRQRRSFARNGFLVLRDALDPDRVAEARRAIEADDSMSEGNQNEPELQPFRAINETLYDYATALVGDDVLPPGHPDFGTVDDEETRVGLHFPDDGLPSITDPAAQRAARGDLGVHVDHQTNADGALYAVGAAIYFDDVQPRDAGFTVWPGSHRTVAEHCELAETETRGDTLEVARVRDDSPYDDLDDLFADFEPFEIAGGAGTVTLWHGALVHSAGMHLAPASLRMAGFSRFHLAPGAWDRDGLADPFAFWDGVPDEDPSRQRF
ncbi:MAG: phytanoyl-CoA dioxygenase family protein [Halobacteriaceae archaeon]